jgi:uncharacterized membrane protein YhiD involved in acid resistance
MDPLSDLLGASSTTPIVATSLELVLAIGLSFLLTLIIAFVYQRTHSGAIYSQDYVHTLIILGTVVTVIIMGIGQNVAAAFGIFAAFSIIRFRRALPESRDVGFIFFAMAVGLACGSQSYALAVITTVLVSLFVWLMWRFDLFAAQRPSHLLRVRVTPELDYDVAFAETFETLAERVRLQRVESVQAGMMLELRYALRLREGASARALVDALQQRNGNNRVILTSAMTEGD